MDEKIHNATIECATKHKINARNTGDKSRIAYQNCYTRHPNFIGTYDEFKKQIEKQFTEDMNWDNYPEWEVDHILPLAQKGEHNIKNLQPMWRTENRSKRGKIKIDMGD
jgi:hypothetical protein